MASVRMRSMSAGKAVLFKHQVEAALTKEVVSQTRDNVGVYQEGLSIPGL